MGQWSLVYEGFDPEQEGLREALCTLGNGYFATRGAAAESEADGVHYPGTYLAGGYNRLATQMAGRVVENEDLVNLPNWLPLTFRLPGGPWIRPEQMEILSHVQRLDLKEGMLCRTVRFKDKQGRRSRLEERRLVHMGNPHLAAVQTALVAENWSGDVQVHSSIDGRVTNSGVPRYQKLNGRHLEPLDAGQADRDIIWLKVRTNQSELRVCQAARTRLWIDGKPCAVVPSLRQESGYIGQQFVVNLPRGSELVVDKTVSLFTSRDKAISECGLEARKAAARCGPFASLRETHTLAWKNLWRRFDVEFDHTDPGEGERTAMILHLYMFHVLQSTSMHTMDQDVGVPSRGWHGEAYRGHIFWDELFIFPLLNLRVPEITRSLLMYRYRRLDSARSAAEKAGYRGAMYPWQSGSNGREETQQVHLNPKSGRWIPDNSHLQRHVNAAIAYNIHQYHQVTKDTEFLSFYGAEMFLEIARFWSSITTYNDQARRYEILGVMGPDEYHDAYPQAQKAGLDNNAYTNIMAVWVLSRALEILDLLPQDRRQELCETMGLTEEERDRWQDISGKMRVVFHDDGIISQFEGYEHLEEFDWKGYRERYEDIQRLDRILESEDDTPNRYKVSKQADVLMLFYLFSSEQLQELFTQLGYPFERETIPKNIQYYLERSSHGSTLSRVVHSWVLARSDRARSWRLFKEALESDVADIQGGTTPEGIHLGAMAGVLDLLKRGYLGIEPRGDVLWFNPALPEEMAGLRAQIRYRSHTLDLEIKEGALQVCACRSAQGPVSIGFKGQVFTLEQGETQRFSLS